MRANPRPWADVRPRPIASAGAWKRPRANGDDHFGDGDLVDYRDDELWIALNASCLTLIKWLNAPMLDNNQIGLFPSSD